MKTKKIELKRFRRTKMHKHKLEESGDEEHRPCIYLFFRISFVICFMLLFVGIGVVSATDYYVATQGNDNNSGTLNKPWQHPSYATQQAVAGDTIYLMDGTWYGEYVVFVNSGTEGNPITMTAYSGTPTLDGNGATKCIECEKSYIYINGLKIIDYYSRGINLGGSYNRVLNCDIGYITQTALGLPSGSHHNTVENSKLHHTTHNILQLSGTASASSHHHSIINNEIYHSSNPGHMMIDLYGTEINDIDIIGNNLHNEDAGQSAIYSHSPTSDGYYHRINIIDNDIHHTWRGIFIAGFQDSIISKNNIHDNSGYGIGGFARLSNITGCGNTFYGNGNDIWLTVDGVKLTAKDFTDSCDDEGDILPPTIIGYLPTGTDVPVGTTITVTFSEAMTQSSAESAFSISPHVSGSFSWNGNKMIFTPSSDLDYLTTYTVTISTVAEDLTGNNLESPFSWSFTTIEEDATPPTTTSVITPTPNEAGWNTVIQVVVTFFRSDTGGAGVSYTNYSETSETGPWTTVNINAAMGPDAENVTDIGEDKFNVTVSDEGVTTIWYYTVNNNATSEPIKNVTVRIDTTPPASISNLQSTTGTTWINWTWTNPTDEDFNHTMVYLNGIFKTNTSNPYYNATGLIADMSYEIGTHTVDTYGNVNTTWVNQTAKTVNKLISRYDVNEDGTVDILDTTIVGQHFGETTSPPYPRYDVNEDGAVDILDTTIVGQHSGEIMG